MLGVMEWALANLMYQSMTMSWRAVLHRHLQSDDQSYRICGIIVPLKNRRLPNPKPLFLLSTILTQVMVFLYSPFPCIGGVHFRNIAFHREQQGASMDLNFPIQAVPSGLPIVHFLLHILPQVLSRY